MKRVVCQSSIASVMPLNVLPSMTNPPVAGSRAPRWMLDSLPVRRPDPHSTAEHDQVEGVHRLDLQPARAAPARLVRRGQRLRHHPFVPASSVDVEKPLRGIGVVGDQPVHPLGLSARSRPAPAAALAGRPSSRSSPSRCSRSKKNTDSGCDSRAVAMSHAAAEPRRGHLEPVRTSVGAQRDRLRRRRSGRSPAVPASPRPPRAAVR